MPTERELLQHYKSATGAGHASLVRFLGECFTDALVTRDNVSSSALAAHFAAKLTQDKNRAELLALIILDYLKLWVENEADNISRARKVRFTGKCEGSEIFDEARVAIRDREAEETRRKVEAWKEAGQMRHGPAWSRPMLDQPGDQPLGASSKPANWKAGVTMQLTKDQAPRLTASCQT